MQLLLEFLRVIEKKHITIQQLYHEPWAELQDKIIEIARKEENLT